MSRGACHIFVTFLFVRYLVTGIPALTHASVPPSTTQTPSIPHARNLSAALPARIPLLRKMKIVSVPVGRSEATRTGIKSSSGKCRAPFTWNSANSSGLRTSITNGAVPSNCANASAEMERELTMGYGCALIVPLSVAPKNSTTIRLAAWNTTPFPLIAFCPTAGTKPPLQAPVLAVGTSVNPLSPAGVTETLLSSPSATVVISGEESPPPLIQL